MSAATPVGAGAAAGRSGSGEATPADVFVVFGITGDLARVMTFRSLYRLERRADAGHGGPAHTTVSPAHTRADDLK